MPRAPKLSSFPAIRGALKFYQVASIITGVGLLLLVAEMILKYSPLHVELFAGVDEVCGIRASKRDPGLGWLRRRDRQAPWVGVDSADLHREAVAVGARTDGWTIRVCGRT